MISILRDAAPVPTIARERDTFAGRFAAMASPCEVLVDTDDRELAGSLAGIAAAEAARIERAFSRYRCDNIVHRINHAGGQPVEVDSETASLIDYAATCHELSSGRFDITSGVLRRVWTFDGGSRVPERSAVEEVLRNVGWSRVSWDGRTLTMPAGMEIDLGGIGKEYAVDRAASLVAAQAKGVAVLVNFGGDLFATGERGGGQPWYVGVDDPAKSGDGPVYQLEITRGGLATSGDARRHVMWHGRRLGHILDPTTGWPVEGAPSSVTVLAATCLEAGTLSTLAMLRGAGAREFLEELGVRYWIL